MSINSFEEVLEIRGLGSDAHYLIRPKSVYDFFESDGFKRKIPSYQRPYSWEKKNIIELLNDLKVAVNEKKGWFLGPIFTTQEPNSLTRESSLLDGQQRTTTIQLILIEAFSIQHSFINPLLPDLLHELISLNKFIERTLLKYESGKWVPVFTPDNSIREIFIEYLERSISLKDYNDWKNIHIDISNRSPLDYLTGYKTFKIAIETIRENLLKIINPGTSESISHFINVIKKLLFDCWIIEIPLQKEESVLDIFESLNNRGKPLSLTDIIKFKSLTISKNHLSISDYWSTIFKLIDKLESIDMVSDEDDFFKYFINTYANKDLTNDKDLIEYFEKHICKNDFHEVEKFLNDVISLCNLIIDLYNLDETPNQFQKYSKKEKDRIKILVVLFEFSRRCTDNVRFLLFYFGRTQKNNQIDVELLENFLLNLTKSVIYNFIFCNKKSNLIRNEFLGIIYDFENSNSNNSINPENFIYKKNWDSLENYTYNYNLVYVQETHSANLLLAYYQAFYLDPKILINYSKIQLKNAQSEHLFPIKWQDNWSSKKYSKQDIQDYCVDFKNTNRYTQISYPHIDDLLDKIVLNINELNISLPSTRNSIENTIIELIGNKFLMNDTLNKKVQNFSFNMKKDKIESISTSLFVVPTPNNPDIGIKKYTDFTHKEIIERSVLIFDSIVNNYNKTPNHIIV